MTAESIQPYSVPEALPEFTSRQCFRQAHSSLGAAGHWIKMGGIMAPLVIGELVKDPDKRWRWIRIASVATALVSEGLYTHRIAEERKERQSRRERC